MEVASQPELPAGLVEGCGIYSPYAPWWRRVGDPPVLGVLRWSHSGQGVEELQENVIRLCCNREGRQEVEYYLRLQEEI